MTKHHHMTGKHGVRTATTDAHENYVPGMGKHWLLPLYDPLTRLLGVGRLHNVLIDQLDPRPGQRILEIGCGTGNLALRVKQRQSGAEVTGLDPDRAALEHARRKAARRGVTVRWDHGFAEQLPYEDGAFDRVLSALMLHHLSAETRIAALRESLRVLAPGGVLHVLDFGGATESEDGVVARRGHRHPMLRDNYGDGIPKLMREAGFADTAEVAHRVRRIMGRITYYRAVAPITVETGPGTNQV
jgi:ubiquinone/menaquinone biosynthesis C-methylase UbiE